MFLVPPPPPKPLSLLSDILRINSRRFSARNVTTCTSGKVAYKYDGVFRRHNQFKNDVMCSSPGVSRDIPRAIYVRHITILKLLKSIKDIYIYLCIHQNNTRPYSNVF